MYVASYQIKQKIKYFCNADEQMHKAHFIDP